MIDFFDVQPKTIYNGIELTDITKLLNIKNNLEKYSITTKMETHESFNDVAYRLYGDDKLFWVLQELNKGLIFSPLLSDEDFRKYMEIYNVSCAIPNNGIQSIIQIVGGHEFSLTFYQYDELIFNTTSNTLINFDKDGNALTFEEGMESVYLGGELLVRNIDYTIGVNQDTDMQYITILTPSFTVGSQIIVRIFEQVDVSKIDTIRNQIILDRLIEKPYEIRIEYDNNISIVNSRFTVIRYGDSIHHYNYNGIAYNAAPSGVDPLKLFEYTWEEYEIAVNEDKRNIIAIKPEYKADMLRIIQEEMEILLNV